jgi:putative endopeptidase
MRLLLSAAASALVLGLLAPAGASAQTAAADGRVHYGAWGVDLTAQDKSINPGDDFSAYAQGAWAARAEIPPDQTSAGAGREVSDRAEAQLRLLVETEAREPKTPQGKQIGDLYNAFMDEARVEALDARPLAPDLQRIAAAPDKAAFALVMARTQGGFGKTLFGVGPAPDPKHPEMNTLFMGQDGLGLPDRDYYLKDTFKPQRDAYLAYIERALTMAGYVQPASAAKAILAFETRIAEASWAAADRRDIDRINNPMTPDQLQAYAPQIDWPAYLAASGAPNQPKVIVAENTAVQKLAQIYADTPLDTLKAWESFHLIDDASPYLSKRFVDSRFDFSKTLSGVTTLRPRWKRGVSLIDSSLGESLGREYAARYFPPSSKAQMVDLIANLKAAMAHRIETAAWMAPSTKTEALKKLAKMDVQVGYPDKWRDYSGLKIDPQDLYGDVQRSAAFEWAYQLSDLNKPVDHKKWAMTPQTVNAYNGGLENRIVFPAGILQPPYFDPDADPAVNYGAAGAIIGHEITHGFDDQGRKIDSDGAVRDWWTAEDAKRFKAQSQRFGAQYNTYEPVPGFHINGDLTMGENIADLGGLLAALDAYHASLHGKPAPVLDGLTGDQRFFLAFAQAWRNKTREDALKQQMASNPHSPAKFRVIGPTRNDDAWYAAFGVTGGKYYLAPDDRARIW